jgi:predicted SnoaL-like aldol condensation-catalyzing enzyme
MTEEQNKALIRRAIKEAHSDGNLDAVDEVYDSEYVLHTPTLVPVDEIRGPEAIERFIETQHAAFPGLEFTIEDQIAEGNKVVTRYGSPKGVMHNAFGVIISRITDDGKIAEEWIVAQGSEFQ